MVLGFRFLQVPSRGRPWAATPHGVGGDHRFRFSPRSGTHHASTSERSPMMKRLATLAALLALAAAPAFGANAVRISQIYGGGGGGASTVTTWAQDFVEIFNSGPAPVNIGGWVIE